MTTRRASSLVVAAIAFAACGTEPLPPSSALSPLAQVEADPCQAEDDVAAEAYYTWQREHDDAALSAAVTAQFRCVQKNQIFYDKQKPKN